MSRRLQRLNVLLRQELSDLLLRELKDPRLAPFVTITRVEVSPDLQLAKVYVSVLGTDQEKASTLEGLTAAAAYLRHELTQRLVIRRVPSLTFLLDETMEEAAHILELIKRVASRRSGQ